MLPVGGRPMIERVLEWLRSHGITEAVLSLGYRPDAFMEAYPSGESCGVKLAYAVEPSPLDTAGAIRFAALEAGLDETFVVVNGDVLTDLDLTGLVAFHRDRRAEATIALTPVADPSAFGVVATDEAGRVEAFVEKPPPGEAPTNLINAGTYVLERSVIDRVPSGRRVSIERETFPQLVAEGTMFALGSDARWLDAGTPAAFLEANLAYAEADAYAEAGANTKCGPEKQASGREATVAAGIVAVGTVVRSVVGVGVDIGEGSWVEGSVIMDGAVVGPRARVVGSIVGPRANIGEGATLHGLCVIGAGHQVEAGQGLVGARLPGVT
jgi:mannose-1-phosphate guanylyltransferase